MASSADREIVDDSEELLESYARTRCPRLRAELVERYWWIVDHVARRYQHRGEPREDIVQVAALGLLGALDRYDPTKGGSFPGFAIPTAMGEVRRHFRDKTWRLRVPRSLKDLSVQIGRVTGELANDLGRDPSTREIADRLDVSPRQIDAARSAMAANHPLPTDARGDDEGIDPVDHADVASEDAADIITVLQLIRGLPARERRIIELCFFRERSQDEVAAELGISQPHVSRLLRATLNELRCQMTPSAAS
jgi:RNA polymerase sigma-B factor